MTIIDGQVLKPAPRKGDWLQTFTGVQFWPMDPRVEDIDIADISHALSNMCRYNGHTRRFYSVAEHCVILARYVPDEHKKWALMHDATEAYLIDVPRPIKRFLTNYNDIEQRLHLIIAERFGLPPEIPEFVKECDTRILNDERIQLMCSPPAPWGDFGEPLGVHIAGWSPITAEDAFLNTFDKLFGGTSKYRATRS